METKAATVITPDALYSHWQGHRGLSRRTIEAFPEKELFSFTIGGMRTFAQLAMEMVDLAAPGLEGIVTGKWAAMDEMPHAGGPGMPQTKQELLDLWDASTKQMDALWPQLSPERYDEQILAFNQFPGTVGSTIFYFIDNEIHHRGQGYVYLRALGIEPPAFWDR